MCIKKCNGYIKNIHGVLKIGMYLKIEKKQKRKEEKGTDKGKHKKKTRETFPKPGGRFLN